MTPAANIPTKDYARQYSALWPELEAVLRRTIMEDDPILGEALERFEARLAAYHGVDHAVGLGSGTSAISLALRGLGVGPGREVITGAHTFTGVVSAIVATGATPVLVDADDRGLLAAHAVASAIGPRTAAIVAVHMYGHPVNLDGFVALSADSRVPLVEDAAQAHGARWNGRPIGSFGVAAATSFHPSKNLGAFGDGGAVLTSDARLAEFLRIARNLGKSSKYAFSMVSENSKLDTLQAALLDVKLGHLDGWIARRRQLAARYDAGLDGLGDLCLPVEASGAQHAYHLYVVRTPRRDALKRFLAERGIGAGLHYPVAVHRQPAHAERFAGQRFPVAEQWAERVLSLPLSHEHTDDEIDCVVDAVRTFFHVGA